MDDIFGVSAGCKLPAEYLLSHVRHRGGDLFPKAAGWGSASFDGRGLRVSKEFGILSACTRFSGLRGSNYHSHASVFAVTEQSPHRNLEYVDLQPFEQKHLGSNWAFVHSGTDMILPWSANDTNQMLGSTSSEAAFYHLLSAFPMKIWENPSSTLGQQVAEVLADRVSKLNEGGEFNFLLTNGTQMIVHAHTRLYAQETIQQEAGKDCPVILISSAQLGDDASWTCLPTNTLLVYERGEIVGRAGTTGASDNAVWESREDHEQSILSLKHAADEKWKRHVSEFGEHGYESG